MRYLSWFVNIFWLCSLWKVIFSYVSAKGLEQATMAEKRIHGLALCICTETAKMARHCFKMKRYDLLYIWHRFGKLVSKIKKGRLQSGFSNFCIWNIHKHAIDRSGHHPFHRFPQVETSRAESGESFTCFYCTVVGSVYSRSGDAEEWKKNPGTTRVERDWSRAYSDSDNSYDLVGVAHA